MNRGDRNKFVVVANMSPELLENEVFIEASKEQMRQQVGEAIVKEIEKHGDTVEVGIFWDEETMSVDGEARYMIRLMAKLLYK